MKCPKCQYIAFDSGQRCRNCGYDFSLAPESGPPDLSMTSPDAAEGPLGDFELEGARPAPPRAPDTGSDLPLFARSFGDRQSIRPAPAPRPPLSVRRASPVPRERLRPADEPRLDLGLPEPPGPRRLETPAGRDPVHGEAAHGVAPIGARLAAGAIDLTLMGAIHAAVIALTLRLCGLTLAEIRLLPAVPLAAFLLMLASGYLISFTAAGGQTIGKMLLRIRVVPAAEDEPPARVSLGSALVRAAGCLVSLSTAGLGYLPALVSHDHRALHDRLAATRVVRA